ncbi:phosphatase PAP2 family protein [Acetobacteraceae bacterium H6797]|nr:phosphatase PAP2 family protein [Acetobacteraceae bacterium H6797]
MALTGWGSAAALVLAAIGLAGEVLEGETLGFDRALLLALRNPADPSDPIGPRWLEEIARDVTGLGGNAILTAITLGVAGYFLLLRQKAAALLVLVSVGGGTLLSLGLKMIISRSRPDLVPHAVEVYTASFPSGHAMLSAITYLTLGALLARVQPRWRVKIYILSLALLTTLLIGASRVYLGVHWPTDVLAGWCLGGAWALLCWLATLSLQRVGWLPAFDTVPPPER